MGTCFIVSIGNTFLTKIKRWKDNWYNIQIEIIIKYFLGSKWGIIMSYASMIPAYDEMCTSKVFPHNCVMYCFTWTRIPHCCVGSRKQYPVFRKIIHD